MSTSRMARYMMMANARNGGNNTPGSNYQGENEMRNEMENRQRYPRREDGTFRPRNNRTYEYAMEGNNGGGMEMNGGGGNGMNMIGFGDRSNNQNNMPPWYNESEGNYGSRMESRSGGNEMERKGGMKQGGGAQGMSMGSMDEHMARKWVKSMKHADGGSGEHWSFEQVEKLVESKGMRFEAAEVYAIMNALYADFCLVFHKHGVSSPEFYLELAKAWLEDKDAVPNKAMMYYECIVKK